MKIQVSHATVECLLQNFYNTRSTVVTVGVFHFIQSDRTKENAWFTRLGAPLTLHKIERAIVLVGADETRRCRRVGCTFFKCAAFTESNRVVFTSLTAPLLARICIESGLKKEPNPSSVFLVISIPLSCDTFVENYERVRAWRRSDGERCASRRKTKLRGPA